MNDKDLVIRVTHQAKQKMEADFIHEMIHAIYYHLGYTEHDEKQVDELANALYMVIQDNKSLFSVT
jgi:predicted metal-dependent peptidase